jgi:hypothetical protein
MVSDKYIAGLLDSDGCVTFKYLKNKANKEVEGEFTAYAQIAFTEAVGKSNTIPLIQENLGGEIYIQKRANQSNPGFAGAKDLQTLHFQGSKAVSIAKKIRQYVFAKRGLLDLVCEFNTKSVVREEFASRVKEVRATGQYLPNYPTRKWMCGYLDGNGAITGRLANSGLFYPMLTCSSWDADKGLLELMKKQFGGSVCDIKGRHAAKWDVFLTDPSKCIQILEYLPALIRLKPQRDYLLSCARVGNFRDGKTIRAHLMSLNRPATETNSEDTER